MAEGAEVLGKKLAALQAAPDDPHIREAQAKLETRSAKFLERLTSEAVVKDKALEVFSIGQKRVKKAVFGSDGNGEDFDLKTWLESTTRKMLGKRMESLNQLLGGMDSEQVMALDFSKLDMMQLVQDHLPWEEINRAKDDASSSINETYEQYYKRVDRHVFPRQLEMALVQGLQVSGLPLSGAELADQLQNPAQLKRLFAKSTSTAVIDTLKAYQIDIPDPMMRALELEVAGKAGGGTFAKALVGSLEEDTIADRTQMVIKEAEKNIDTLLALKDNITVAGVIEHLEGEDIEGEIMKALENFDVEKMLAEMESAVTSDEARQRLVSNMLDICLDFMLRVLPGIKIPQIEGTYREIWWEVKNLDMAGIKFRKENVKITLGDFEKLRRIAKDQVGGTSADLDLLILDAWDISAHFYDIECNCEQTYLPYLWAGGLAHASAYGMSLKIAFRLKMNEDGEALMPPQMELSRREMTMTDLELVVEESTVSWLINSLSYMLVERLKVYVCRNLMEQLDAQMDPLCNSLNAMLAQAQPFFAKLGWVTAPKQAIPDEPHENGVDEEQSESKSPPDAPQNAAEPEPHENGLDEKQSESQSSSDQPPIAAEQATEEPQEMSEERFNKAVWLINNGPKKVSSSEVKLRYYKYYKQATVGDVEGSQPWATQLEARAKWDAWRSVKGMSKTEAMQKYVGLLEQADANWEMNEALSAYEAH